MRQLLTVGIAILCITSISAATISGVAVQNKCMPYFTEDMIAFNLVQVYPSNPSQPLTSSASGKDFAFLPCAALSTNSLPEAAQPLCSPSSVAQPNNLVYIWDETAGTCKAVTNQNSVIQQSEHKDINGNTDGVVITYTQKDGDTSVDGRPLVLQFLCNKEVSNEENGWTATFGITEITFSISNKAGCGNSLNDFFGFFNANVYLFGGCFITIGLIFAFFGRKWFTYTLVALGFLIGFLGVVGLAYAASAMQGTDNRKKAVFLILGTMFGSLIAFVFYKFKKATTMAGLGFLFFLIGNAIIRFALAAHVTNQFAQWGIVTLMVIIGVAVGYSYSDHCIIFATSFAGSFLATYSVGMMTKTLDSPAVIEAKIRAGEHNVYMYVYGGAWVLLGLGSLLYQCNSFKADSNKDKADGIDDYKSYN